MSTNRLYYHDSHLRSFTARVISVQPAKDANEVILDQTAFYPEGGGQPTDLGTLNGARVVGVVDRDGQVIHRVQGDIPLGEVTGDLDWDRRLDHMQQHSGQHILSQAFEQLLGAKTVSFHMGAESCTIDLSVPSLATGQVESVEQLANQVVFEDRPILVRMVEASELARFNLRKETDRMEQIRLVEVEGFDTIPCGGTHCRSAGEIGLIKVVKTERRSGNSRVEFHCGGRALRDYQAKNQTVVTLAAALSVRDREVRETVERLIRDSAEIRHQTDQLRYRLLDYRAEELARRAEPVGTISVVATLIPEATPDDLKQLASRLTEAPGRVALLATAGERGQIVFARSDGLPIDAGAILRQASAPFGGRGGGQPKLAQGGIPEPQQTEAVLEEALRMVKSLLAV